MIRFGKRVRAGFTLVEMLVVIVIIAILASLITAAAANALWSAKQTKIKVEVDMLAGAMEAFKQKYNSYPPANLSCTYDPMSGNYTANAQLVAFVARAFPRYAPTGNTHQTTLATQIGWDLQNAGVDTSEFNPQVALVFWLSGFGPDPTDPFNRANVAVSRSSFFGFNQTQLMAWYPFASPTGSLVAGAPSPTGTTSTGYGIGQFVYNAPYGNAAYCYFDSQSYGTLNIAGPGSPFQLATSASPGIVYANTGSGGALPSEYLNGPLVSLGIYNGTGNAAPYIFDVNGSGGFNVGDTFCKPTSFQIISAGQDGNFGNAQVPTSTSNVYGRLYPTGVNYDVPPPGGSSGDDDNVTNFCEKNSLESAKP